MSMTVTKMALIMFSLLGVVLTVIALQGLVGGEWETIGNSVALVIGMIGVLGVVVGFMVNR